MRTRTSRSTFALILVFLLASASPSSAGLFKDCTDLLKNNNRARTSSVQLTAYLEDLLRRKVISQVELQRFSENLKNAIVSNPIDEESASTNTSLFVHREGLEQMLKSKNFDLEFLRKWATSTITKTSHTETDQKSTRDETASTYVKMDFQIFPPHKFKVGRNIEHEVEINYPFGFMTTKLTQSHWFRIFGENPAIHDSGENEVFEKHASHSVRMLPDNPIENITWWSAVYAANRLSEQNGLKPAYDLTGIEFMDLRNPAKSRTPLRSASEIERVAAAGALATVKYDASPKINAPNGNPALTEGYRLPTEAEFEYIDQLESEANSKYDLEERGWVGENSKAKTHPVATLRPLAYNGKGIYDLKGNVSEWIYDWHSEALPSGVNSSGPAVGNLRVKRGSSTVNTKHIVEKTFRNYSAPEFRAVHIGVRFVITKKGSQY